MRTLAEIREEARLKGAGGGKKKKRSESRITRDENDEIVVEEDDEEVDLEGEIEEGGEEESEQPTPRRKGLKVTKDKVSVNVEDLTEGDAGVEVTGQPLSDKEKKKMEALEKKKSQQVKVIGGAEMSDPSYQESGYVDAKTGRAGNQITAEGEKELTDKQNKKLKTTVALLKGATIVKVNVDLTYGTLVSLTLKTSQGLLDAEFEVTEAEQVFFKFKRRRK